MTRLYRVRILTRPEGSDQPGWRPEGPWEHTTDFTKALGTRAFTWPSPRRVFHNIARAKGHAALLESFGATVDIERSDPITWSESNVWQPPRARTPAHGGDGDGDLVTPTHGRARAHEAGGLHA